MLPLTCRPLSTIKYYLSVQPTPLHPNPDLLHPPPTPTPTLRLKTLTFASRTVATAFLAAAGLQFVVLCLSVSDGLRLGTRLWLLVSAAVLSYAASGSTVGGKRGRKPGRAIWSTAGRRVVHSGGSLMPLFWAGGAAAGKPGGGGGGGRGGGGGPGSWGRRGGSGHKE